MKSAGALAASVVALAASGASAAPVFSGLPLHVSPVVGHPHTTFRLRYVEPASGFAGDARNDVVELTGPGGVGCLSSESVPEQVAAPGSEVVVRLRPTGGHVWCVGMFTGRVEETITPRCEPGQVCPQFIALVPIGNFRFVVRP